MKTCFDFLNISTYINYCLRILYFLLTMNDDFEIQFVAFDLDLNRLKGYYNLTNCARDFDRVDGGN